MNFITKYITTPVKAHCYAAVGECGTCYELHLSHDHGVVFAFECSCGQFDIGTSYHRHHYGTTASVVDVGFTNLQKGWPEPKFIRELYAAAKSAQKAMTLRGAEFLQGCCMFLSETSTSYTYNLCDGVLITVDDGVVHTTIDGYNNLNRKFEFNGEMVKVIDTAVEEYSSIVNKTVSQSLEKGVELPQDAGICVRIVAALRGVKKYNESHKQK